MTTCKHADSGCNYPEGECAGVCMSNQHENAALETEKCCSVNFLVLVKQDGTREEILTTHHVGDAFDGDNYGAVSNPGIARRLAACWNACKGLATADLERGGLLGAAIQQATRSASHD